jgi:hypothetical protein
MFSNILINDREYYTIEEVKRFLGWFSSHWGNYHYKMPRFMGVCRGFKEYVENICMNRMKINNKVYVNFEGIFNYLDNTLSPYIRYDRLMKHNKNHREFIYECFGAYCNNRQNEEYYNSIGRHYSF